MTPTDFPTNLAHGNDDRGCGDEDDNPYTAGDGGSLGTLRSYDAPGFSRWDDRDYFNALPGEDGDTLRIRQRFGEFARVQLGNVWYRCSDFGVWRFVCAMERQSQQWNTETGQIEAFDLSDPDPLDY